MKSCDRGEALVELADKFTKILSELTAELQHINKRIDLLENPNHVASDISESVKKLQELTTDLLCDTKL
jgi:hypothetical protein